MVPSEGQVGGCLHTASGEVCGHCDTVFSMALGLADRAAITALTDLADDYADQVIDDLASTPSQEQLRKALAGAFLSFLTDAVHVAHSLRM